MTHQQRSAPAWSVSPAHVSRYSPGRACRSVSHQWALRERVVDEAGAPHSITVGVSGWQKWSTSKQPHPLPQPGTSVFEALFEALLGLEGKITPVEAVRDENLAAV